MPKDRRSSSLDRSRVSPYSRSYQDARKRRPGTPSLPIGNENEWEETRCPICMEHPHNAVLLLCSSREKGCLPYMCSTSSRHSNCLDQFRKSSMNADTLQEINEGGQTKLVCPLCRGQINGWIVVKPARQFMDSKTRSCSLGTCDFSGNYSQLSKHARCEHPNVRPTDVDPERELEWRILEEDMEQQDMRSMQFEFVDDDDDDYAIEEFMDGVPDLDLPVWWDHDFDSTRFLFHTEFDSFFSEFDIASDSTLYLDDSLFSEFDFASGPTRTHNRLSVSSRENSPTYTHNRVSVRPRENGPTYTYNRESVRPRENVPTRADNRSSVRPRGYGLTTRSRSNTHRRHGSNSQPSSRNANRQEQLSTIVDFHELSSNRP